ncbi:site-specific integrase (plasmid) [Nitrobacter sp. NHB1]|uniref:site-specific integrase n=1 Tax=Nitrobacter sp. NHB1 TaxID=3119830 RepID=UPI002FFE1F4A
MSKSLKPQLCTDDPANILAPFIKGYREHFEAGRYAVKRIRLYVASVFHFGDWMRAEGYAIHDIGEVVVSRFLSGHLSSCTCSHPVQNHLITNRAALNHLIRILRAQGMVSCPTIDALMHELALFDAKMAEVWGLSQGTRDHRCRIIRRLLKAQFGSGPIDPTSITPSSIRGFVLGDATWSANTIRVMAGAVRCYLRYRKLLGDNVTDLIRAVPQPACWSQSTLPEALSDDELQQLFRSFDSDCPSRRRGYAIVRCLADLGLRSSEVVRLSLDDIDWQTGTVRITFGKGRRADVLPLPAATGEAIADYLLHERPKTPCRNIFVRHVAPIGSPVGRRVVQQAVHAAYRRLGWDRTRVHILRHTLATRLVNTGAPMKQIADVMRHRSIVTSATYARVDVARLSAVALSWPGSAA